MSVRNDGAWPGLNRMEIASAAADERNSEWIDRLKGLISEMSSEPSRMAHTEDFAPRDFVAMAEAHRLFYSVSEAEAAKADSYVQMDREGSAAAEVTTFVMAACLAAREHGVSAESLRVMLALCIEDVR